MHIREIKSRIPLFRFISVQRLLANEWSVCELFHVEWGTTMAGYFDSAALQRTLVHLFRTQLTRPSWHEMPCTWLPTPCGIAYSQTTGPYRVARSLRNSVLLKVSVQQFHHTHISRTTHRHTYLPSSHLGPHVPIFHLGTLPST